MDKSYRVVIESAANQPGDVVIGKKIATRQSDLDYLLRVGAIEPLESEAPVDPAKPVEPEAPEGEQDAPEGEEKAPTDAALDGEEKG